MKEIKMKFGAKILVFQVTFESKEYIFAECNENPAARGFFTIDYVFENSK